MKIVHFSDWHEEIRQSLPEADLYICTGDMLPNWDIRDPAFEGNRQDNWIIRHHGKMRKLFGSHDAPVVCVRGNHDFTDISGLFGGDVSEITLDSTQALEISGMRIGGFRGVPPISGRWSDEMDEKQLARMCQQLPRDLDIIVTHGPPHMILDDVSYGSNCYPDPVGSRSYWGWLEDQTTLKLACFGHIHEEGGRTRTEGGVIYSNASQTYNEITL